MRAPGAGVGAGRLFLLLVVLTGACGDSSPPLEPPPPEQGHPFTYRPRAGAPTIQSISVRGDFNDWAQRPLLRQADGSWRAAVALPNGRHRYKFFINGEWPQDMCFDETWGDPSKHHWIDPDAAECEPDGVGGQNAVALIGEAPGLGFRHAPTESGYVSAAGGRVSIRFRAGLNRVQSASVIAGSQSYAMHHQLSTSSQDIWRVSVPEGTAAYRISVTTAAGTTEHGPYNVPGTMFRAVSWVSDAVGYQIFPERFWNGDPVNDVHALTTDAWHFLHPSYRHPAPVLSAQWDAPMESHHCCHQYYGGDLQGVIDRLDHLSALGVSLIYLNPIFLAGSAHGYDGFDFMSIAPNFGDEHTARRLLDAARARGIRVMWDFVPNHVGVGHRAFLDAVEKGTSSAYWNWFRFKVPAAQVQIGNGAHYDGWWGLGSLPELNTATSAVHAHLMEATRYWTEFGFDGIRVDVPESVRNPRQFFPAFRQAAKAVNPNVYLVGEVWGRSPLWLQGDEFDSLMNYALGLDVVRRLAAGEITATAAAREMSLLYAEYPEASTAMQFNIISSHDTSRLLTLLGGGGRGTTPGAGLLARQRFASALLYALPGVPVTFQGDECAFLGAVANRDEQRYPMQWQSCDAAMVEHYTRLAGLKRNVQALRSPVIRRPTALGPLLSFYRGEPGTGEVLAVFNSAADARVVTLPAGSWTDSTTGEALSGSAPLAPLGWRFLERRQ
jgi:cyclomaltodextrinase / maltogenic alpha-amylase / neopullulanase